MPACILLQFPSGCTKARTFSKRTIYHILYISDLRSKARIPYTLSTASSTAKHQRFAKFSQTFTWTSHNSTPCNCSYLELNLLFLQTIHRILSNLLHFTQQSHRNHTSILTSSSANKHLQNPSQTFYMNITPLRFNNLPLPMHWTPNAQQTHPLPPNILPRPFWKANPPYLYLHPTPITCKSPNTSKSLRQTTCINSMQHNSQQLLLLCIIPSTCTKHTHLST
jgi:hypothetical protein